jgi:Lrp/AsnC family leucine-responsive transcriptional regulator
MEEDNVIKGYWTAINTLKLGYYSFIIHINFLDVTNEIKDDIINYFKKYNNLWSIISVNGPIDLEIVLFVNDVFEFNKFWDKTLEKFGIYFDESIISILTQETCYKKSYLIIGNSMDKNRKFYTTNCRGKPIKIDKIDYQILDAIALNARIPLMELSKRLGISSPSVCYRIKKLTKKEIIKAFRVAINIKKLGLQNCSINIFLRDQSKKKDILKYLINNPYFEISVDRAIGCSDLSLEFMVENNDRLNEIMDDISYKFPGAVRKSNFWISKKIHKERWLPEMNFK